MPWEFRLAGTDTVNTRGGKFQCLGFFLKRIKDFGIKKLLTVAGNTLWKVYEIQSLKGLKQWQTHLNYWIFFSLQLGEKVSAPESTNNGPSICSIVFSLFLPFPSFLSLTATHELQGQKKRNALFESAATEQIRHTAAWSGWYKKVINWFTDMAEWVKWHHIPPELWV